MKYAAFFHACLCLLLVLILVLSQHSIASSAAQHELRLTLPQTGSLEPDETSRFYEQALRMALEKTRQTPERIIFDYHTSDVKRERARLLVKQGKLDIIWSSSSKEREAELLAVKFNLIRGINEYRLLLIRANDQVRFDQVKTLTDLKKFRVGSGTHWSDTDIYRFNGLPLVTSYAYQPMFRMLSIERFDYMARGIQEVNDGEENYEKLGLAIEKNLLIHYPQPIYFFLNHHNQALAERIQRGLEIARADGSLDNLFLSIPKFREAWEQLQQLNRITIRLNVPE